MSGPQSVPGPLRGGSNILENYLTQQAVRRHCAGLKCTVHTPTAREAVDETVSMKATALRTSFAPHLSRSSRPLRAGRSAHDTRVERNGTGG